MLSLLILVVAFVLLILLVVWGHFLAKNSHTTDGVVQNRDDTNVTLYHEHKTEIENDFKQGRIDEENYQYLLAELNQSLLQDIESNKAEANTALQSTHTLSLAWPISISLFVLIFSMWTYSENGAYEKLALPQQMPQETAGPTSEQELAMQQMQELLELVKKEPDNSNAWYSLGQSFIGLGNFEKAIYAFDQVIRVEGESAELFGAKAQAHYYKNNQVIDETVQGFIDSALALDAGDPSTNILLGMHNFISKEYERAIAHWQTVIDSGRQNVNVQALKEAVKEAKNRLTMGEPQVANSEAASTTGPQLTLNVALSDEIMEKLIQGQDKTVFIYAISASAENGRMPLAAIKINASDLPATIVLDDTRAMTPQAKLSDVNLVHVYAIVSNTGGAGIKSGDYKAEKLNVAVSTSDAINLTIDNVVP